MKWVDAAWDGFMWVVAVGGCVFMLFMFVIGMSAPSTVTEDALREQEYSAWESRLNEKYYKRFPKLKEKELERINRYIVWR